MKKRIRTLSAGISVGVTALTAVVLATTPAAAALKSLSWHTNKSLAYCSSLPHRTTLEQMRQAQCKSEVMALQQIVINEAISRHKSQNEIAAGKDWPGPGH